MVRCGQDAHQLALHYTLSARRLSVLPLQPFQVCTRCVAIVLVCFTLLTFICRVPSSRAMDICIGWPTVTDLLSFVCRCQPASTESVCLCVRRSHILLCYFLRSMAVAANISVSFFFAPVASFLSFSSFSMHIRRTDRRRKHLIAFYHENKHKPVLVCAVIISSRTLQHVRVCGRWCLSETCARYIWMVG